MGESARCILQYAQVPQQALCSITATKEAFEALLEHDIPAFTCTFLHCAARGRGRKQLYGRIASRLPKQCIDEDDMEVERDFLVMPQRNIENWMYQVFTTQQSLDFTKIACSITIITVCSFFILNIIVL